MGSKRTSLSRSPKHISRSSGLFLHYLYTFLRLFGHFLDHRKLSGPSRLCLDYPDIFSRLSGHFLDRTETFQFIHTLFRSSRHFPVHLDTLHINWILFIASRHFPNYPEILQPIMNLSGFAMLPCY